MPGKLDLSLGLGNRGRGERGAALFNASGARTRKVIVSNGSALIWLCTADAAAHGYIAQKVERNNVLSGSGDLGGNQEVWRRTLVWIIKEALICNQTATATSGAGWASANLNSTTNPYGYGADSVLRSIGTVYTPTNGDYKEYTVWVDADGKFTILVQDRTGLSPLGAPTVVVTDAADDSAVGTFACDAGTAGLRQVVLTHPTKRSTSFTARITKSSADTRRMTIVGVNSVLLTKPADPMPSGVTYDFDTFIRLAADVPFCNHDGAQDYAFRDLASGKTGGSVHGGETSTSLVTTMDGVAYTFPNRAAGSEFIVRQSSLIDYTAFGGGTITVDAVRDFSIDGRPRQTFSVYGASALSTAYLGMSTPWVTFKTVQNNKRTVADATAGTGDIATDQYDFGSFDPQMLNTDPATGNTIKSESSAVVTYPRFEHVVVYYYGPPNQVLSQYVKRWNLAIDSINRPLGRFKWKTADEYRIA